MKKLFILLSVLFSFASVGQTVSDINANFEGAAPNPYAEINLNIQYDSDPYIPFKMARMYAGKWVQKTDTVDFSGCDTIIFRKGVLPVTDTCSTASGTVVFYLTDDRTNTGTALYPIGNIWPQFIINDVSKVYAYGWVLSNSNRTLTVTVKYQDHDFMSGLYMTNAPNNTLVRMTVTGN